MQMTSSNLNHRIARSLFIIGFFAIFSTTIAKNPVLPLFASSLGSGDALIGLIAAVSPFAGIVFSFPVGVLSDHIGRKRLLATSGIVFLCAPLLYLTVTTPLALIPIRFFHGLATAILGPVVSAVIAERFPHNTGEVLGQYASATLVGRTLAPLTAGIILSGLAASSGLLRYQAVYLVAFATAIPVCALAFLYREDHPSSISLPGLQPFRESFLSFFRDNRLRSTALVDMGMYFLFGMFETFLPLLLVIRGIDAFRIGILFAVQVIVIALAKPSFGRLADRSDKRPAIVGGLLLMGISAAFVPFILTFPLFMLVGIIAGIGMALSTVATSAFVAGVSPPGRLGASMGALSSVMDIGHSAGPLVAGVIITVLGYPAGFLTGFALSVLVSAIFLVSVRYTGPLPGGTEQGG
jgi:MFS family permease